MIRTCSFEINILRSLTTMERKPMLDICFLQLCLIFACHHFCCSHAQGNVQICTPPCNQCNFNFSCDPPSPATCIRENIALGKQVSMSSEYATRNSPSLNDTTYGACLAFDGDRSTGYDEKHPFTIPNCIHTNNSKEEWLQVDLGKNYTITNITVYRRHDVIKRLANIRITVDSQLCYRFPSDVSGFPEKNYVNCSTPLIGRVVKLSTQKEYINLCEVEIWVCKSGFFGNSCEGVCHCKNNVSCENYYGTCSSGCDDGYYGLNCSMKCGHCLGILQCNESGHCPTGCQTGWEGPMCDVCSSNCFGPQCKKCGNCIDAQPCNSTTGECANGCVDGYEPPLCNETCRNKMYGHNCNQSCFRCKNAEPCDVVNGSCADCEMIFLPPFCTECEAGYYGINCTLRCGSCIDMTQCNPSGHCLTGCQNGWQGSMCTEFKSDNTGIIVGAVVGSVVAATIIVVIAVFVCRNMRRRKIPDRNAKELSPVRTSVKPQASVKPSVLKTPTRNEQNMHDVTGPVYTNVAGANNVDCSKVALTSTPESVLSDDDVLLEDSEELYYNDEATYATLKSAKHELDRTQRFLVDQLTSGMLLEEFKKLSKTLRKPHETALLSCNIRKNRFTTIVPYDDNRVVLTDRYTENGSTDFVNASYIRSFSTSTKYIAAQGPRDNTAADLWRMVWQERVKDIVMLTNLQEGGKNKCYEYWPAKDTTQVYGPVRVTAIDVQSRAHYILRTFTLGVDKGEELKVTQYHFTAWPDHGVPTVTSLVDFWRFVRSRGNYDSSSPLLVHCSAGVGRTGTYIGLDIAMDKVSQKREINLLEMVDFMRNDRTLMVQTPEQYVFLHKALLEAYTGRDTKISIDQFDRVISQSISTITPNRRIDTEFQSVMLMRSLTAEQCHDTAIKDDNVNKNRNKNVLPADNHIVYLTEHVPGRNQYINAVYMSTFSKNRGSILTQLPLSNTLVDFWRLVYGTSATAVVSLGSPDNECDIKDLCCFWKGNHLASQTDPYNVFLSSSTRLGNHLDLHTVTLTKKDTSLPREVQVLRYDGWLHDVPDKSDLLHLVDTIDTTPVIRGSNPLIIQCIDGGFNSGLFCAIRDIISRVTYDREVDVYMTVRNVQSVRPEAVTTVEQYRYCYEVAQHKVREMSVYANMQQCD